jgi:hypothetical protein
VFHVLLTGLFPARPVVDGRGARVAPEAVEAEGVHPTHCGALSPLATGSTGGPVSSLSASEAGAFPSTGLGSIGGGDAVPERADGNHLPELQADGPGDVRERARVLARVRLLEQLLAARRSTTQLEAALREVERFERPRHRMVW